MNRNKEDKQIEDNKNIDYFKKGSKVDLTGKVKQKQGLSYLSWASAWAEFKKLFPEGNISIHRQVIQNENTMIHRPWFDDGKTGWVEVEISIDPEKSVIEWLPIMDFKNKSIPAENITSMDANKAYRRCAVKAIAMLTGIGLYIYEGEDIPEDIAKVMSLQEECLTITKQKCKTDELKEKVGQICKTTLPEECNGDPRLCEDSEILTKLKKALMALRVVPKKENN